MRRSLEDPEEQHRIAAGAPSMYHGQWITLSPAVWFDKKVLDRHCPSTQSLLEPDILTIPNLNSCRLRLTSACNAEIFSEWGFTMPNRLHIVWDASL